MLDPSTQSSSSRSAGFSASAPRVEGMPHSATLSRSSGGGIGGEGMTDGYGEEEGKRTLGGVDFFDGLGTEKKRKDPNEGKPDPSKVSLPHVCKWDWNLTIDTSFSLIGGSSINSWYRANHWMNMKQLVSFRQPWMIPSCADRSQSVRLSLEVLVLSGG